MASYYFATSIVMLAASFWIGHMFGALQRRPQSPKPVPPVIWYAELGGKNLKDPLPRKPVVMDQIQAGRFVNRDPVPWTADEWFIAETVAFWTAPVDGRLMVSGWLDNTDLIVEASDVLSFAPGDLDLTITEGKHR